MTPGDLVGVWLSSGSSEAWVATPDGWWGVGTFVGGGYEVLHIDAEGVYVARPSGGGPTEFAPVPWARGLRFESPEHDFPQRIEYRSAGGKLRVHLAGGGRSVRWVSAPGALSGPEDLTAAAGRWSPCAASPTVGVLPGAPGPVGFAVVTCDDGRSRVGVWTSGPSGWDQVYGRHDPSP